MNAERVERRLAAILAADVAGYSRLMGEDEAGTLARLNALRRELIDPQVADHKGRIVKTTGDGLLIEFPSVVEAVACANMNRVEEAREAVHEWIEAQPWQTIARYRTGYSRFSSPEMVAINVDGLRKAGLPEQ